MLFYDRKNTVANYCLQTIILENITKRDKFLQYTNEHGVMTRLVWQLVNILPMFNNCLKGDAPNAVQLSDKLVNMPSSVKM